jgi:hypothetical protein
MKTAITGSRDNKDTVIPYSIIRMDRKTFDFIDMVNVVIFVIGGMSDFFSNDILLDIFKLIDMDENFI